MQRKVAPMSTVSLGLTSSSTSREEKGRDSVLPSWELTLLEVLKLITQATRAPGAVQVVKVSSTTTTSGKSSLEVGDLIEPLRVTQRETNGRQSTMDQPAK